MPNFAKLDGYEIEFADDEKVDLCCCITQPPAGQFFADPVQSIGATIPLAEVQARRIAATLKGDMALSSAAEMTREVARHHERKQRTWLNSARYPLEVDARRYTAALRAIARARIAA